ncbi:efflux transporter outer membrane subunit [Anaeromyxobacter oryzae]|uniref:Membrane protein n=1 Tax=Anaeromyxobacter oryzae TaxID=2918170 RepID=A0ABN6MLL2_9BACT|nr:efflux transporter outer membrane subunit [Anaeromyxobacter oryzae]BDG01937.1 membrane protein [Anaeromyxobacter oryzae]
MNRTALVAAALAAAGCSFAPAYRRPDAGVPAEYRLARPGEANSIADLPWWQVFSDPVLQELIAEALAANQDLALATARVAEFRANAGIARADLFPQLAAQATGGYGQPISDKVLEGKPRAHYSVDASVFWELDIWGRVRNGRDAAIADLLATEDGRHAVVLSLVSGVAQAYLELRALDLQLEIARSNAETRRGTLQLFEARGQGGIASDLEVNQARADLAVTLAAIPQTEMLIWMKEHELCVLLGRAPGSIKRGTALADLPEPPELPAGVPAQLLERRPDVLAAEQNIIAAGKRVGVAVAERLPTLSLSGFIGLQARNINDVFDPSALAWDTAGSLFAPIFQGGRLKSAEEAARARLEQSVAAYRKTVEVALQEVADASAGVLKLRDVRAAFQTQVTATTAASTLAMARYQGGVSSYLEVLDAQRQQFDAQLSLANAMRDELTSLVLLYRALGGGWRQEAPPPPPQEPPPPPPGTLKQ